MTRHYCISLVIRSSSRRWILMILILLHRCVRPLKLTVLHIYCLDGLDLLLGHAKINLLLNLSSVTKHLSFNFHPMLRLHRHYLGLLQIIEVPITWQIVLLLIHLLFGLIVYICFTYTLLLGTTKSWNLWGHIRWLSSDLYELLLRLTLSIIISSTLIRSMRLLLVEFHHIIYLLLLPAFAFGVSGRHLTRNKFMIFLIAYKIYLW